MYVTIIAEKADGEIEELHVTEKDVLAIEETLKKLKNRLSESSFNSKLTCECIS